LSRACGAGQALAELKREVAEFEATIVQAFNAPRDHIGASAELLFVSNELVELVRMVDGLNRHRFRNEPEVLAEWQAASRVRAFTPRGEEPVKGSEPPAIGGLPPADGGKAAPAA
jgi:hypothetical protein